MLEPARFAGGAVKMHKPGQQRVVALGIRRHQRIPHPAAGVTAIEEMRAVVIRQLAGGLEVAGLLEPCRAAHQCLDAETAAGGVAPEHIASVEIDRVTEMTKSLRGADHRLKVALRSGFPNGLDFLTALAQEFEHFENIARALERSTDERKGAASGTLASEAQPPLSIVEAMEITTRRDGIATEGVEHANCTATALGIFRHRHRGHGHPAADPAGLQDPALVPHRTLVIAVSLVPVVGVLLGLDSLRRIGE